MRITILMTSAEGLHFTGTATARGEYPASREVVETMRNACRDAGIAGPDAFEEIMHGSVLPRSRIAVAYDEHVQVFGVDEFKSLIDW